LHPSYISEFQKWNPEATKALIHHFLSSKIPASQPRGR